VTCAVLLYAACCRCWTYETSLLVNQKVDEDLPVTTFYEYFAPDYSIAVVPSKEVERDNQNKKEVRVLFREGVVPRLRLRGNQGRDADECIVLWGYKGPSLLAGWCLH
jgi:hypothetical protein